MPLQSTEPGQTPSATCIHAASLVPKTLSPKGQAHYNFPPYQYFAKELHLPLLYSPLAPTPLWPDPPPPPPTPTNVDSPPNCLTVEISPSPYLRGLGLMERPPPCLKIYAGSQSVFLSLPLLHILDISGWGLKGLTEHASHGPLGPWQNIPP